MREEERGVIAELVVGKISTMRLINEVLPTSTTTGVVLVKIATTELPIQTTTKTPIIEEHEATQKLRVQKEVINGETGESKRIQQ